MLNRNVKSVIAMSVIRLGRFLFRSFYNILPDVKGKNCNFLSKFCIPNCRLTITRIYIGIIYFFELDVTNVYIISAYFQASGRVPAKPLLNSRSECRDAKSIATELCASRSPQIGNRSRVSSIARQFSNGFTARVGFFPNGPAAHFRSKFIFIAILWRFS